MAQAVYRESGFSPEPPKRVKHIATGMEGAGARTISLLAGKAMTGFSARGIGDVLRLPPAYLHEPPVGSTRVDHPTAASRRCAAQACVSIT